MPIVPTITGPTVQFVCLLSTITGQTNSLYARCTVCPLYSIVHVHCNSTQDKQTIHCMPIVPTITGPTVQFV